MYWILDDDGEAVDTTYWNINWVQRNDTGEFYLNSVPCIDLIKDFTELSENEMEEFTEYSEDANCPDMTEFQITGTNFKDLSEWLTLEIYPSQDIIDSGEIYDTITLFTGQLSRIFDPVEYNNNGHQIIVFQD